LYLRSRASKVGMLQQSETTDNSIPTSVGMLLSVVSNCCNSYEDMLPDWLRKILNKVTVCIVFQKREFAFVLQRDSHLPFLFHCFAPTGDGEPLHCNRAQQPVVTLINDAESSAAKDFTAFIACVELIASVLRNARRYSFLLLKRFANPGKS